MNNQYSIIGRASRIRFLLVILLVTMTALIGMNTIMAEESTPTDANLDNSYKSVNRNQARAGETIEYTISISNSGDFPVANVWLTDSLPSGIAYVEGSLKVTDNQGFSSVDDSVVSWYGELINNQQIQISYKATISESLKSGVVITNTIEITGTGNLITRSATTSVIASTPGTMVFPLIMTPLDTVHLDPISRPTPENEWILDWDISDASGVDEYQIEEAANPEFVDAQTSTVNGSQTSLDVQHPPSAFNEYYYRVRAVGSVGGGPWSNTELVVGGYRDDFGSSSSGWAMRREDTDHIENKVYYQNGHLVHEMDSSWDYLIAGPMALAPEPPYRIETRVRLEGVDNLHGYGLIFGGDWNGQTCPNSSFTSCFNQYYRLIVFWSGDDGNKLSYQLKRVDFHDPRNNAGRGTTLIDWRQASVKNPPKGYQQWAIEVYPNGRIKIFVNGNFVKETVDANYIDRPYFGTFSATDEYAGLMAEYDWYEVKLLP